MSVGFVVFFFVVLVLLLLLLPFQLGRHPEKPSLETSFFFRQVGAFLLVVGKGSGRSRRFFFQCGGIFGLV